jgi:hypothetical protein
MKGALDTLSMIEISFDRRRGATLKGGSQMVSLLIGLKFQVGGLPKERLLQILTRKVYLFSRPIKGRSILLFFLDAGVVDTYNTNEE